MTNFINLTPHDITVLDQNGNVMMSIPVSGIVARVTMSEHVTVIVGGIPLVTIEPGVPQNIPAPHKGIYYIVSRAVQESLPYRKDLLVPARMVRSADRRTILGCAAFSVNPMEV